MYIYIYISSLFHPVSLFQRWLELLVASCFTPPFLSSNLLEEQRNTQIFILNNLHFFLLTFLTQISNPLFVKDFSHNLAYIYINHTKYQEKCQLGFSTNTRIKRNRSGERRRNWNEIITLKATGLRRRAGMDKKKTKLFQRDKRKRCRSLSGKMHATISPYPAENFSTRQLFSISVQLPTRKREKEVAIPPKVSSKVFEIRRRMM